MTKKTSSDVGYKNPPVTTRFKPGHSGNPRGRPKSVATIRSDLSEELREIVVIRKSGTTHQITKQRAIVIALISSAMSGDLRAVKTISNLTTADSTSNDVAETDVEDLDLLESYIDRERKRRARVPADSSSDQSEISND